MKYKVILTSLILTIFTLGILIGTPINNNANIVNIMIALLGIIYILLIKNNNKKEKKLKNKIDVLVLIFCISPIIPIIFRNYASLNDSIVYLIKYLSCFILYMIVYTLNKKHQNTVKYINITFVLTILVIIIFGIDILTTNIFSDFLNNIGSTIIDQGEIRLSSTFGYGNTFAAVVAFGLILNIGLIIKSNNKKTIFVFGSIAFIYMASFILSYSRLVYIIFAISIIVYLILVRERVIIFKIVEILLISGIYGIIYSKIFMDILNTGTYINAWIWLILFSIMCGISILVVNKFENKIKNISLKLIIAILIIITLACILFIAYALNQKSDLILFNTNNTRGRSSKIYL